MVVNASVPTQAGSALSVREVRRLLGVSRERMGNLLGVSAKTIERWEAAATGPTNVAVRARLARVREIASLGRVVYTAEGFGQFLDTPLPIFGQRAALQLIALGDTDQVLGALAADYEGLGF